jgi:hypothetical protein
MNIPADKLATAFDLTLDQNKSPERDAFVYSLTEQVTNSEAFKNFLKGAAVAMIEHGPGTVVCGALVQGILIGLAIADKLPEFPISQPEFKDAGISTPIRASSGTFVDPKGNA